MLLTACRYMELWLAAIGGEMIKLDHSFKAAKRIRDSAGQQQFAAVLTIMNEFCQVSTKSGRQRSHAMLSCLAPSRLLHVCTHRQTHVSLLLLLMSSIGSCADELFCCSVGSLQIHATIPTATKSLQEVQEHLAVFMENQEKLGVRSEGVGHAD